ncbi:MAG: dethiobiotin synthase [Bacteroides sp.]|nr:dethiobiotin synthase [Bacteroides sp.]MCM1389899.1 dethiobiotin synthase [Bacteroides sp.]
MSEVIFISGIDTDAGKTYMTGMYARRLMEDGKRVITQKFIQTGNDEFSEDIEVHRQIMGTGLLPEDVSHLTAPVIFSYPASAQLAARIDGRTIDTGVIEAATEELSRRYDVVLVEGAGGLMVPITDDYFTIDYVKEHDLPLMLVTNSVLGSINHTVLSLEAVKSRGIKLKGVIYNSYFDKDKVIAEDTTGFIQRYVARHFPEAEFMIF